MTLTELETRLIQVKALNSSSVLFALSFHRPTINMVPVSQGNSPAVLLEISDHKFYYFVYLVDIFEDNG